MNNFVSFLLLIILLSMTCCEGVFIEDDLGKEEISLVAPYHDAISSSTEIHFYWNAIKESTEYTIQIASPSFETPLHIIDSVVVNNNLSLTLANGTYQWKVKGMNKSSETDFSLPFNLTVNTP